MTRHQVDTSIPWMMTRILPPTGKRLKLEVQGGGYGYGLFIFAPGDRFKKNGALARLPLASVLRRQIDDFGGADIHATTRRRDIFFQKRIDA